MNSLTARRYSTGSGTFVFWLMSAMCSMSETEYDTGFFRIGPPLGFVPVGLAAM